MSKGKELKYSVNRSFEKIKLSSFRDVLILGENQQYKIINILQSFIHGCESIKIRVLTDVFERELAQVDFSVTSYSNIQQVR